jgi:hypothetical protein
MDRKNIAKRAEKEQDKLVARARKGVGRMQMQTDGKAGAYDGASQNALAQQQVDTRDAARKGTN